MGSARGVGRRQVLGWSALAGVAVGTGQAGAEKDAHKDRIPPDTKPGGAYDRYMTKLAAEDRFSGSVVLSYRGRTVLSRSYGMADREKGIRNHEGIAVNLGSAVKPFVVVAVLQLAQQHRLRLEDPIGKHLTGFPQEVADRVRIFHLLQGTSGLTHPAHDLQRVFHSKEEVHAYYEQWTRQTTLQFPPGSDNDRTGGIFAIAAQIVEKVTGQTYWDYAHEHVFGRAGMTGAGFFTRPQWLTDPHIGHSYMLQHDGSRVDAVRNLDKSWIAPFEPGKNPGRNFIDHASDGGFASARDLVRFGEALLNATVLERPFVDLLTGPKQPNFQPKDGQQPPPPGHLGFAAYGMATHLSDGMWTYGRAGANPGSGAAWTVYRDLGWATAVTSNYDDVPLQDILGQEQLAITGRA
ncbi:serine hydrolase [Lentzea guizhouensis]|uniref:Serine hydrolase n=1 Tax=Lentzea guizhouensis TaxID=1586287 RepID=A0A1B2HDQ1_9PSEU|nr:serine hydrolase domain-containing protein [Lentzea guizhouensis]ANZ35864.1 serine hydrolase [Lentzea guizhouensis]